MATTIAYEEFLSRQYKRLGEKKKFKALIAKSIREDTRILKAPTGQK